MTLEKSIFLRRFTLSLLIYTLIVILWGAFVRISHSGDGCGKSWPLCMESWVPPQHSLPTWIEFSHRLSSGLFGFVVLFLVFYVFKNYSNSYPIRRISLVVLFFTITEGLLGALLVLAGWVGSDDSLHRVWAMSLHLINSMFLVGSIVWLYDRIDTREPRKSTPLFKLNFQDFVLLILFLIIGTTGAVAALSTTLFPSESLTSGLAADLTSNSHYLLKMRISHPLGATLIAGLLIYLLYAAKSKSSDALLIKRIDILTTLIAIGVVIGFITLFSLSPLFLKLLHLLWAYGIWVLIILCLSRRSQISE